MAQDWQAFPSGTTTGINRYTRPVVDHSETVGSPLDAPATGQSDTNGVIALLKGMASELGIDAGTGDGVVNTSARINGDLTLTLGDMTDPPAIGAAGDRWSAISLLKGICSVGGL